jgi:hypothetical protein
MIAKEYALALMLTIVYTPSRTCLATSRNTSSTEALNEHRLLRKVEVDIWLCQMQIYCWWSGTIWWTGFFYLAGYWMDDFAVDDGPVVF